MTYIKTKNTYIQRKYNGYKCELPNNIYKWKHDNWYETKASPEEKHLIDMYVNIIDDAVKYITNEDKRNQLIMKLIPIDKMPNIDFKPRIIQQFYNRYKKYKK